MGDTSSLMWGVLFGAIGTGYVLYGRRQKAPVPLLAGIALMVFPYFFDNPWAIVATGAALSAAPYFIRL